MIPINVRKLIVIVRHNTYSIVIVSFFLSLCYAPKRPSPFFLYIPHKHPLLMINYELSTQLEYIYISKWVKNWHTHEPCYAPPRKIPFINAVQPFYGCQQSVLNNITVTVSVRVCVTVRVSLVWLISSNSLVALSIAIWWMKYITPAIYLYQFSNAVQVDGRYYRYHWAFAIYCEASQT